VRATYIILLSHCDVSVSAVSAIWLSTSHAADADRLINWLDHWQHMHDNVDYYTANARMSQFPAPVRFSSPSLPLAVPSSILFAFRQYIIRHAARSLLSNSDAKYADRSSQISRFSDMANVSLFGWKQKKTNRKIIESPGCVGLHCVYTKIQHNNDTKF